jgi:hypothetical protein
MDMKMEDFSFCLPREGNESALIYPVKKRISELFAQMSQVFFLQEK